MVGLSGYFKRRWRGEVAWPVLFWRDMVGVGSFVNVLLAFLGLMLVSQGVDAGIALAVHSALLPYNLFLFLAVWRAPHRPPLVRASAAVWMGLVTIV